MNDLKWKILFALLGLGNLIHGAWMLISPIGWYTQLPGRVPDFGPLNEHFVRDLGCMFVMFGILAWASAYLKTWRKFTLVSLQLWYVPHALVHFFDTARGLVGPEHFYIDIPLCYLPPIMIGVIQYLHWQENSVQNFKSKVN